MIPFAPVLLTLFLAQASDPCTNLSLYPAPGSPPRECPAVYQVWGDAPPETALNLVILGEGYTYGKLEAYRCAAARLVRGVMQSEPFATYACRVNIYRIDNVLLPDMPEGIQVAPVCNVTPCDPDTAKWVDTWLAHRERCRILSQVYPRGAGGQRLYGTLYRPPGALPGFSPRECVRASFNARLCGIDPDHCDWIWPDSKGEQAIGALARCAPNPAAVVLLVNADEGTDVVVIANGAGFPMTVVDLADVHTPDGWVHLAHEMGHLLLLLDEYGGSDDSWVASSKYIPTRNILAEWERLNGDDPPWIERCPVVGVVGNQQIKQCEIQYNSGQGCLCPSTGCGNVSGVGLWQGAAYTDCLAYRSLEYCRMENRWEPFCPACGDAVDRFMLEGGWPPCTVSMYPGPDGFLELIVEAVSHPGPPPPPPWTANGVPLDLPMLGDGLPPQLFWPVGNLRAVIPNPAGSDEIKFEVEEVAIRLLPVGTGRSSGILRIRKLRGAPYDRLEWRLGDQLLSVYPGAPPALDSPLEVTGPTDGPIRVRTRVHDQEAGWQDEWSEVHRIEITFWDIP